jgi:phosphoribosyl 1,2-cyclic phosphodiesterase
LRLRVLATGSKGNCYLLQSDDGHTVVLDAGVAASIIQRAVGYKTAYLDGVLVTHEHQDHMKSARDLATRGIPVWMTAGTMFGTSFPYGSDTHPVAIACGGGYSAFDLGGWRVLPFPTQHDAVEPVGYLLTNWMTNVLYATDTFYLKYKFVGLTHIIIECNYCTDILYRNIENGLVDPAMKKRLLNSHFSLENVISFLRSTNLTKCVKIVLVHLSAGNSDAKRMVSEVLEATGVDTVAAEAGMDIDLNLTPF